MDMPELMNKLGALCERLDRLLVIFERMTGTYLPGPGVHEIGPPPIALYGCQPKPSEPYSNGFMPLYGVKPTQTGSGDKP